MSSHRKRGRPQHSDVLTPSEWRVVDAVRHGLRNREIAAGQGVGLDAVKYHVANALQKLGLSSRHELRRWTGVRRDCHLFAKESSMERDIKLGSLAQIARTVRDVAAARAWYGETLGLTHLYSFGKLAFFDCGGVRLMLSEGAGAGAAAASDSILYFQVDTCGRPTMHCRSAEFISLMHPTWCIAMQTASKSGSQCSTTRKVAHWRSCRKPPRQAVRSDAPMV